MSDWKLEIRRVNNGFILKGIFGMSEEESEEVIEFTDDGDAFAYDVGRTAVKNLLNSIRDYFCIRYNKHSEKNVDIVIVNEKGEAIDNE